MNRLYGNKTVPLQPWLLPGSLPAGLREAIAISRIAVAATTALFGTATFATQSAEPNELSVQTTATLKAADWHGKWIGLDGVEETNWLEYAYPGFPGSHTRLCWIWFPAGEPQKSVPPGTYYFRREIVIPPDKQINEVHLEYAGDDECRAWINGFDLGTHQGWHAVRDADVTSLVHHGTNVICLAGTNIGPNPKRAGVIAYLEVGFVRGDSLIYWTDEQWRVSDRTKPGWEQPGFDDSQWSVAKTLGPVGEPPWGKIRVPESRRLPARYLRKDFVLNKKVARAVISFCGLGWSELYVNGAKVSDSVLSPEITDYQKRVAYLTWDITKQLHEGTNTLGAILGNGTYYAPRSEVSSGASSFGWPKMLLQLRAEYSDGTTKEVVSDDSWQISTEGPIRANNIFDGEEYDANYELTGWNAPGYGGAQVTAMRRRSAGRASVSHYNPPPGSVVAQPKPWVPVWQPAHIVAPPAGELFEQRTEPARVAQTLKPVAVSEPNPGVFVFDMGQVLTGWCRLKVTGPAVTRIVLRHAFALKPDGTLDLADLRGAKATDSYTLRGTGAKETWEPRFTCHRFRYVELTGYPGHPTLDSIEARVVTNAPFVSLKAYAP